MSARVQAGARIFHKACLPFLRSTWLQGQVPLQALQAVKSAGWIHTNLRRLLFHRQCDGGTLTVSECWPFPSVLRRGRRCRWSGRPWGSRLPVRWMKPTLGWTKSSPMLKEQWSSFSFKSVLSLPNPNKWICPQKAQEKKQKSRRFYAMACIFYCGVQRQTFFIWKH